MSDPDIQDKVDVAQLRDEAIPEGTFPAGYPFLDFRVWIEPNAHRRILSHADTNTRVELCGILVGRVERDEFGPFAVVEDTVEGKFAQNQGAQVTFTQETWAYVFSEMDRLHTDKKMVGWYHTHPGFGVFLSPMDTFIHENFFNLPWQMAFVVDPLGGKEGVFVWRDGEAAQAGMYWVGDEMQFSGQPVPVQRIAPAKAIKAPTPRTGTAQKQEAQPCEDAPKRQEALPSEETPQGQEAPTSENTARKQESPPPRQAPAAKPRSTAWDIVQVSLLFIIFCLVGLLCMVHWGEIREFFGGDRPKALAPAEAPGNGRGEPAASLDE